MGPRGASRGVDARRGNSYRLSSFSSSGEILGVRTTMGDMSCRPSFSVVLVCWLGRLQDSNSASSRGVTARKDRPRILLLDLFHVKRTSVATSIMTSVPNTTARMIQILVSILSVCTCVGVVSCRWKGSRWIEVRRAPKLLPQGDLDHGEPERC